MHQNEPEVYTVAEINQMAYDELMILRAEYGQAYDEEHHLYRMPKSLDWIIERHDDRMQCREVED